MIHILLTILKIIGILILILIGVLVLLVLVLLFVPVRYRCTVKKPRAGTKGMEVHARISWLLKVIQMEAVYRDGAFSNRLRIAGIPAARLKRKKKAEPSGKDGAEDDPDLQRVAETKGSEAETVKSGMSEKKTSEAGTAEYDAGSGTSGAEKERSKEETPVLWVVLEYPIRAILFLIRTMLWILEFPFRVFGFGERLKKRLAGLKKTCEQWKRFLTSEMFLKALHHVKAEIIYMIRHILPRRVKGWIRYGFSDPALTGETLGLLGMLIQKVPKELTIIPVFEEEILRLEVFVSGRLYGYAVVRIAWRLFFDKNLRQLWKTWKKKHS